MASRIGVDIGGTFTDLLLYDDSSGEVSVAKGLSTPHAPDEGVINVVKQAASSQFLGRTNYFLHGATVGINALLERKGAKVGLITTKGFRDILEFRRGTRQGIEREHVYDVQFKAPEPLVPRSLRVGVTERIDADGAIVEPLDPEEIRAAAKWMADKDVTAVAVMFLNAHANGEHEKRAAEIIRSVGFEGSISLSHEVSSEFREYERLSTTVVDAYIRTKVETYLGRLHQSLGNLGFGGRSLVTVSGGGAVTFDEAASRTFETIMSGPVAGVIGAGELCRRHDIDLAITGDVGGTSFDTALLIEGEPIVKYEGEVVGMPLQAPWVDVRSIGSGGGSIAYSDGGLLRVGPQSAGAEPGPVCYGRGGSEPTVTDAAATLGMLGRGALANGMHLDVDAARAAISRLGEELNLDVTSIATGIVSIASAAMAEAIRTVSVEIGEDPRSAALIQFGGAGPLFAVLLARELEIDRVLIPNHAGNFSAFGLLVQNPTQTSARTAILPLDPQGIRAANEILGELIQDMDRRSSDTPSADSVVEAALDLRYAGQEYTLTVKVASSDQKITSDKEAIRARFDADYQRSFGHTFDSDVEIVAIRASRKTVLPPIRSRNEHGSSEPSSDRSDEPFEAYSFEREKFVPFEILDRGALREGEAAEGPLIVTETTTTTYVDAGWRVASLSDGTLDLTRITKWAYSA